MSSTKALSTTNSASISQHTPVTRAWYSSSRLILLALAVCLFVFHLLTLARTPMPYQDDAWYASRAWAVTQTGYAYGPLDNGIFNTLDGYWTYTWLAGSWLQSLPVTLFGPNLFAIRVVPLLCGIVLLIVIYLIARKLYSSRAALITIFLGAFSATFISASHVGRLDILTAVLGYGALALYFHQDPHKLTPSSFFTGLALGFGFDIHPTIIIFVPVVGGLLLMDHGFSIIRTPRAWGIALGMMCGVGYFVAMHILPYPQTYAAISRLQQSAGTTTAPITIASLNIWINSFLDTIYLPGLFLSILAILAILLLRLINPIQSDRRLTFVFGALMLGMITVVPAKPYYYAITISPILWLALGAASDKLLTIKVNSGRPSPLYVGLIIGLIATLTIPNTSPLFRDFSRDYESALQVVRQIAPPGTSVIGQQLYWFARPEQPYYAWEQMIFYRRVNPGSTLEEALAYLRPNYIIIDSLVEPFLTDNEERMEENTAVSKTEMLAFLEQHATIVADESNPTYGRIRIYKINW